jgi:hypothetical protein
MSRRCRDQPSGPAGSSISSTNAATITVTDSIAAASAGTPNGADVTVTVSSWGLDGGNAVVALFGAENSDGITATFGGEAMSVVNVFNGDIFLASFAYLINPTASTGDVVINANNNTSARLSNAYSVFSLSNVGSFADSATRTSTGSLSYTTVADGGYVFLAGVNNNFNGPAPSVTATNADLTIFSAAVDGNQSTVFAHGDVPLAGTFSESIAGSNFRVAGVIAFDAVPEPSSALLIGFGGVALLLHRRRA